MPPRKQVITREAIAFWRKVRTYRRRAECAQEELAGVLDISAPTLCRAEKVGKPIPLRERVLQMCAHLELSHVEREELLWIGGYRPTFQVIQATLAYLKGSPGSQFFSRSELRDIYKRCLDTQ